MPETAETIVNDALLELVAQEGEQAIDSFEFQRGVRYLNRMMNELDANSVKLGYTEVTDPNDVITVAAGAINGMVTNLAVRLAPALDIAVTPALAQSAKEGMDVMRQIGFTIGKANFPANLPIGSGNEYAEDTYGGQHFYQDCCEDSNTCNEDC